MEHPIHMRRIVHLTLGLLFAPLVHAQNVNDAVEIDYQGVWYPGKILKVEGEKYFVSYDEWNESWNEWVGKERLRGIDPAAPPPPAQPPPTRKYSVGDRVEIQYGFSTANATVMAIHEIGYELKIDGMDVIPYREDLILRKLDQ